MKRIIHLTENTFYKLFLTEGISDVTYHYCCLEALYGILKDGKIKLSMESNKSDAYHRTKMFYLSTQRSKSLRFGYARNSKNNCRIELDGYQLKADGYEGMPLDYWGGSMGKQSDIGLNASRVGVQYGEFFKPDSEEKRQKVMDMQAPCTNFEFEDRIFSDVPSLPLKYIKRVDCLINKIVPFEKAILSLASNLGVNIFFYDNERDFTLQTSNIINQKIIMLDGEFEEEQDDTPEERNDRWLISIIVDLLGILFFKEPLYRDSDYERVKAKTMEVLSKFGLEKFYEKVVEKVPEKIRWANEHCFTMADQLRKLNTKSKSKFSENVKLLGQYVLRTHGVNNFSTLRAVIEKERYGKKEEPPRNVVEEVKCVISSYQDNWENDYSVLDGEKRLFWDFIYKDQFYHDIKRQLDDDEWNQQFGETPVIIHKSKNNESFIKYIQHIMRNDNLSLYDGATILYKIFGGNIQKIYEVFGCVLIPIDIDKESFMKHLDNFSSSDRNDIEERLFKDWQEYGEYYNKFKQQ